VHICSGLTSFGFDNEGCTSLFCFPLSFLLFPLIYGWVFFSPLFLSFLKDVCLFSLLFSAPFQKFIRPLSFFHSHLFFFSPVVRVVLVVFSFFCLAEMFRVAHLLITLFPSFPPIGRTPFSPYDISTRNRRRPSPSPFTSVPLDHLPQSSFFVSLDWVPSSLLHSFECSR